MAALGAHNPYTVALLRSWRRTRTAPGSPGLAVASASYRQYAQRRDQGILIMAAIDQADDLFAGLESREETASIPPPAGSTALRQPNLRLLVSIREDALPEVTRAIGDGIQFRLSPLGIEAAHEAAEGPGQFDSRAARELVSRIRTSRIRGTGGDERLSVSDEVEPALLPGSPVPRLRSPVPADADRITMREMRRHGDVDAALSSYCGLVIGAVAAALASRSNGCACG